MCILHSITGIISNLHNMRSFPAADTWLFLFQHQRRLFGLCPLSDLLRSWKERSKLHQNVSTAECSCKLRNLCYLYVYSSTVQLSYRSIKKREAKNKANIIFKKTYSQNETKPLSIVYPYSTCTSTITISCNGDVHFHKVWN